MVGRLNWRWVERGLIITAVVLYLVFIWRASAVVDGHRTFTLFDDAMISMRYGRNFIDGHGLVFNNGQHVEGYTNLLWTLIMGGVQGVVRSRRLAGGAVAVVGGALLVSLLALVRAFTRRLSGVEWAPALALAATVFSFALLFWTLRGMEVGLLAALITGSALLVARTMETGVDRRSGVAIGVLLTLALFTRDDAAVPALVMLFFLVLAAPAADRRRVAAVAAGGAAIAVVARLGLRGILYGHIVPNTYVLKVQGIPKHVLVDRGLVGLGYVLGFGLAVPLALAVLALGADASRPRRLAIAMLTVIVAAQFAYSVVVGGDAWEDLGFANRFLATVVGPLAILAAIGLATIARQRINTWLAVLSLVPIVAALIFIAVAPRFTRYYQLGDQSKGLNEPLRVIMLVAAGVALALALFARSARPVYVVLIGLAIVAVPNVLPFRNWVRHNQPFQKIDTAWAQYGQRLKEATQPNARIAASSIGNIGYFSQRPIVDELGKIDEHVARLPPRISYWALPGHWRWDPEYSVVVLQPDVVAELFGPSAADVQAIKAAGYTKVPAPDGHGPVFVRRNTDLVDPQKLSYAAQVAR